LGCARSGDRAKFGGSDLQQVGYCIERTGEVGAVVCFNHGGGSGGDGVHVNVCTCRGKIV
jgi:hypothetical protein